MRVADCRLGSNELTTVVDEVRVGAVVSVGVPACEVVLGAGWSVVTAVVGICRAVTPPVTDDGAEVRAVVARCDDVDGSTGATAGSTRSVNGPLSWATPAMPSSRSAAMSPMRTSHLC